MHPPTVSREASLEVTFIQVSVLSCALYSSLSPQTLEISWLNVAVDKWGEGLVLTPDAVGRINRGHSQCSENRVVIAAVLAHEISPRTFCASGPGSGDVKSGMSLSLPSRNA